MSSISGFVLISILGFASQHNNPGVSDESTALPLVARQDWGARPARFPVEHFTGPAPYVIIHHSYLPDACFTAADCARAMRTMQNYHQLERGWNDIGYSFAIGGDGMIYVGRGFNIVGAHAPHYNDRSVGICFIGDWRTKLPPDNMLQSAKRLIEFALARSYLHSRFQLLGHRQVRDTECPGNRLFQEISKWPHFSLEPEDNRN